MAPKHLEKMFGLLSSILTKTTFNVSARAAIDYSKHVKLLSFLHWRLSL